MEKSKKALIKYANDELITKDNADIVEEVFATDYVAHASGKKHNGHSFIKSFIALLHSSIPDIQIVEIKFLAEDENSIAWHRTSKGTHIVEMKDIPPSGKVIKWNDMIVTRFNNGKIAEEWVVSELMGELLLRIPRV